MASPKKPNPSSAPSGLETTANASPPTEVPEPSQKVGQTLEQNLDSEMDVVNDAADEPSKTSPARYFSFLFLLGVIGLVGVIFYWVMAKFIIPMFLAALLVVIFRPVHRWILEKTGGREKLAAGLTTASILLAVLVPLAVLTTMAAAESRDVLNQFNSTKILNDLQVARKKMKLDLPNADQVRDIDERLIALQSPESVELEKLQSHGTSLFEISESAQKIAQTQGLDSSPASTDGESGSNDTPRTQQEKWLAFSHHLNRMRDLHGRLADDMNPSSDDFNIGLHEYREELVEAQQTFAQFKYDLLGGKTRAFAIELLNPTEEKLRSYAQEGRQFLQNRVVEFGGVAGSIIGSLVIGTAIMLISLYFFLLDGPAMVESFKGLSPLDDEHEQELATEFTRVSRAVVVATLLSALAQGILAGIGFYFVSLDSIFLLTLLSAVLAMVPFVGAAAVWMPCCFYLYFFENRLPGAIGLAIYGMAVISMADNFIKPYVLHGETNLHPLLALLSVIGGVTALGPIGILIGPMVVVFLQTLLKILQRELAVMENAAQARPQ